MKNYLFLSALLSSSICFSNVMCTEYFNSNQQALRSYWYDRLGKNNEAPIHLDKPMSILAEQKQAQAMGVALSKFDERFETRMYYSGTGGINEKGEIPYVDPNSKAVFIFLHGSGTMASSGKNFNGLMNQLSALGFSSVSFDMPHHAEGPIRDQFDNADFFMNWLDKIVVEIKKSGKPVYMVGHSFGPDVISEYVYRNPFKIQGAVALSPAGFDSVLSTWYDQKTSKMKFGGDVQENRLAGQWAYKMSQQFQWNRTAGKFDATVINPEFKFRMLSGGREEYVPAPVGGSKKLPTGENTYDIGAAFQTHFKNAIVTIEPGVGHYIFNHSDKNGHNVILREILSLVDLNVAEIPQLRKSFTSEKSKYFSPTLRASQLYGSDRVFKTYVDQTLGFKSFYTLIKKENHHVLNEFVVKYEEAKSRLDSQITEIILNSDVLLPAFYQLNKDVIDAGKASKKNTVTLSINLFDYLRTEKPEVAERLFKNLSF